MAIAFSCACGQKYSADESRAGASVRCKKCGATMTIPRPAPLEVTDPEIIDEDDSAPVPAAAGAAPAAGESDGPRWFQGYTYPKGKPRACRVYRVGGELLLIDAGPHVVDNDQAHVRAGAALGGVVGALIGLAAGAVVRKLNERKKEEAKHRQRQLDALPPAGLLREADAGPPNRRWPLAGVTDAALWPPSLFSGDEYVAVVHLRTADGRRTAKTKVYFDRQREAKEAAALLREALGEEHVTVNVPLTRKGQARAEVRKRRIRLLAQCAVVAAAVVLLVVFVLIPWARGKLGGAPAGGGPAVGGDPAAAPGGFAVVDAPPAAPPLNPGVADRKEHRRLVRQLADDAPPFDPARPPTARSTFGHLAALAGVSEPLIEAGERRLKGGPLLANADEARYVGELLRGQGGPAGAAAPATPKDVWAPIPIDKPSAPFKLGLPTGIPLEPSPARPFHPGLRNGPFFVPYPWWLNHRPAARAYDLARDPKNRNRYVAKVLSGYPAHPVIDLRDGKTVGEFDWQAPVWANARLSPDGSFLAGTDTFTTLDIQLTSTLAGWENGKDLLYVWARGKNTPATLKVPGPVEWMEFVTADRLAYVTSTPNTVLRVHDVARNRQVAEIDLAGAKPAPHPDRQFDDTPVYPGLDFYRPLARHGAVSAGGKYVALGCLDGVRLVSVAEGKVVGLLPVANARWYAGLNFSADGARLFGFVVAGTPHGDTCFFRSWSVATGRPPEERTLDPYVTGPIHAGPVEGLYLATSKFFFTGSPIPLEDASFRVVRVDDEGTALVIGTRAQAPPDTPPCRSLQERIKARQAPPEEADRKDTSFALFTTKLDWSKPAEKVRPVVALLAPRPPAAPGDRAGVVAQKPEPPAAWAPPAFAAAPAVPEEGDDPAAMHQFAAWPVSFGDDRAALVRYVPNVQYRKHWEVWLDLLDRTTGKRAAPAARLWDWAFFPEERGTVPGQPDDPSQMSARPLPPLGALRPDAGLFALVDPGDARRVDLFKPTGERVLGLVPYADRRIDWLGWTGTHLLTVGAGRLTAWDPSSGKAVFEVEGGYTYAGAVSPDRRWVVLWAGTHADVLDAATGKCLGRCRAGGFSGCLAACTLSPDGRRLAAAFTGWPAALPGNGPGYTAVVWNLETGKAGLHGFAGDGGRLPAAPTCVWAGTEHLLVCGGPLTEPATLLDARLGRMVGSFKIQGGGYVAGQPAAGTPDGRVWFASAAIAGTPPGFNPYTSNHPDFPGAFAWHTVSLPGLHGKDAFLADAGREWVEPSEQPVQVQAKVGTAAQGEAVARSLARAVGAQGFQVGPGGTVLRVEGVLETSNEAVTFAFAGEAKIPQCVLSGRWLSPQGTELWKGKTTRTWSPAASKYKVSEKAVGLGPGYSERRLEFDFKGRTPSSAMREELLEALGERADLGWLELPELRFLRARGQDHPVPVAGTMGVRMPPGAK
jgi:hypothetical protein